MKRSKYQGLIVDPNEAPQGFYALSKSEIPERSGPRADENICHFCDWREQCCDASISKAVHNHRCMPHTVISTKTKEEVKRNDNCSVIFKRRA